MSAGPLAGLKAVEMAGIGPGPFAAMVLADLGVEIVRVDRPQVRPPSPDAVPFALHRGRPTVEIDLKHPEGPETVLRLVEQADILLEGYRPGVMERLGLGPDTCLARNPRLVYGRMTGWGQDGPLAQTAGHDIDYIAVAGALRHFARRGEAPVPPLNLIGDFGGGGMLLVVGLLAAVIESSRSGQGQVVDAAMVDGTALLMAMPYAFLAQGIWNLEPGVNLLDTGAPFYDVYETADGEYVAVGALEAEFYAALLEGLGLDPAALPHQLDREGWPELRERFAKAFKSRTRDDWVARFDGTDACVAPVLRMDEAPAHPHIAARQTYVEVGGVLQPAPAPRFGRTPARHPEPSSVLAAEPAEVLAAWNLDAEEIARLRAAGAFGTMEARPQSTT